MWFNLKGECMRKFLFLIVSLFLVASCANDLPPSFGEIKAYPNPFVPLNQVLTIEAANGAFPSESRVTMQVFDVNFHKVFEQQFYKSGNPPEVKWSGYLENGKRLPAGVYIVRLTILLSDYSNRSAETKIVVE